MQDDWPYHITSESLDLSDEKARFPSQEEILEELKQACRILPKLAGDSPCSDLQGPKLDFNVLCLSV